MQQWSEVNTDLILHGQEISVRITAMYLFTSTILTYNNHEQFEYSLKTWFFVQWKPTHSKHLWELHLNE